MWRFVCVVSLLGLGCGDGDPPVLGGDGGRDASGFDGGGVDSAIDSEVIGDSSTPDAAPEECDEPGTTEEVSCGACGTAIRFCTIGGVWEYGPCGEEIGICTPGETDAAPCGSCGTQMSVCSSSCEWEPIGECTDEGECAPGERVRTSDGCDAGETRELICADSCSFEESMECVNDECDSPGEIESVECGRCGTQERFCTSARVWEYGPCGGEGVCDPGTTDAVACGNCGTQTSRCNTSCRWVASGGCSDEGECAPGDMRSTSSGCPSGEERIETCDDTCSYEAGMCMPVDDSCMMLDLLFVIDDSGSMSEEQMNLVLYADDVIDELDTYGGGGLDWRIGVTTTGRDLTVTQELFPGFPPTVTMDTGPNGALLQPEECGLVRPYIRHNDANRVDKLECLAGVGTTGSSYEMPLLMMERAVSDRVVDGSNSGFFRAGAMLGIIVITDENDCSFPEDDLTVMLMGPGVTDLCDPAHPDTTITDPMDAVDALDAAKGRDSWATYTIAGPTACSSSFGDASEAVRLEAFDGLVPANTDFASICTGDLRAPLLDAIDHFQDVCHAL